MEDSDAHILVVDDDRRLRDLLQRFLADNGFMVDVAADAAEARRKLESFAFDLLIVDVMMPGESGLSLTEGLRRASSVPILMLSAMGEAEDRIAGLERGADDYLPKPFRAARTAAAHRGRPCGGNGRIRPISRAPWPSGRACSTCAGSS